MIDLNLRLDYKKEPYQHLGNQKIFTLNEKGLEDYHSKEHITHKYLSRFHPKVMEYVRIMSQDPHEEKTLKLKKQILNLPKIINSKKSNSGSEKIDPSVTKSFLPTNKNLSRNIKKIEKNESKDASETERFTRSNFPTMNCFFRLSNSNFYKNSKMPCENIREICLSENERMMEIFSQFKVPSEQRKHYNIEVKVNKSKYT